jgi:hypothetical protein
MIQAIKNFFIVARQIFIGSKTYYCWVAFLGFFIFLGINTYLDQYSRGLITTAMRDQVSWDFISPTSLFWSGLPPQLSFL